MEADTTPTENTVIEKIEAAPAVVKPKRQIKAPGAKAPAKPKAPAKVATATAVKPKPVKALAPKEPQANVHVTAGLDVTLYAGLSKFVNQNRKTKVMAGVERSTGSLTDRMRSGLYALRKAYNGKQWQAKGFDNGILSELAGSGLIELHGGITENVDGHAYMMDGPTPVVGKVTAKGMKYGVV